MYREENIFKEVPRRLFFSLLNGYEKRTRMSEGEETNLFVKRERDKRRIYRCCARSFNKMNMATKQNSKENVTVKDKKAKLKKS